MPQLTDYRLLVANLNGEESAPNPAPTSRDTFINVIIGDIWGRHKWTFRRGTKTLVFSGTTISLPTDFDVDGFYDLRSSINKNRIYKLIEEKFKDNYIAGDNVCWITDSTLNIKETDNPTLELTYLTTPPVLTTPTSTCSLPTITVASGSYAMVKAAEDDEYDTRRLDAKYEEEIRALWRQDVKSGRKDLRMVGPSEKNGFFIGQIR